MTTINFMKIKSLTPYITIFISSLSGYATSEVGLKQAYAQDFLLGVALNRSQYANSNSIASQNVHKHFNCITAENGMKWESLQKKPGSFNFEAADKFVAFGTENNLKIIGHTLIWHDQTPDWVFKDKKGQPLSRKALLKRMRDHIYTVVGRYKGRVHAWDVVNEALAEDGRLRQSPWLEIIGEDFIEKAFQYAHEADPNAHLYYNDYNLETPQKRQGAVALVKKLKSAGIRIDGVGIQEHVSLKWPSLQQIEKSIKAISATGVYIMITELDINVLPSRKDSGGDANIRRREAADPAYNPYTKGLPQPVQQALSDRYVDLFQVYLNNREVIHRVTFWGLNDGNSWLNNWPIPGRTSYPLLFDRQNQAKPALKALIQLGQTYKR